MARKKKETIEVTTPNEFNETNLTTQEVTKTNENEQQKVTFGVVIAKGGLRIREEQDLNSKIVKVLPYQTKIEILEEFDEWVRVENGFMMKKFIEIEK